jgi:protein TonB
LAVPTLKYVATNVVELPMNATLGNVVPFPRRTPPQGEAESEIAARTEDRPAPAAAGTDGRGRLIALLGCSMALHVVITLALNREPTPMPSIGLEAISVEIVLADAPATNAADAAVQSTAPPADAPDSEKLTERTQQDFPPESTEEPKAVAAVSEEVVPVEQPAQEKAAEPVDREPTMTAETSEPVRPEEPAVESPPKETTASVATLVPTPETRPPLLVQHDTKPVIERPKRVEPTASKSRTTTEKTTTHAPTRARVAARTNDDREKERGRVTTGARTPNGSSGGAQAAGNSNYYGLVAAHLARYKQYPSDARSRGEQGTATVSFRLDGSGRVSSVSLQRGSGSASLDRESVATVGRASPFPAPPSGQAISFSVPLSFRIR